MSAHIGLHSALDTLAIDAGDGTIWLRNRKSHITVALTLTSKDRDALVSALLAVDTKNADEDAEAFT
jgi:hypothetical protein